MKSRSTILTLCLSIAVLNFSCYRVTTEKNTQPQGYSVAQIIGTWKITGISSDKAYDWGGNGVAGTNIYSTWTNCQRDNLYKFSADYTGSYKRNCSELKEGTWLLSDNNILIYASNGQTSEYEKITALTSNFIKTVSNKQVANGQVFVITKEWTRQ